MVDEECRISRLLEHARLGDAGADELLVALCKRAEHQYRAYLDAPDGDEAKRRSGHSARLFAQTVATIPAVGRVGIAAKAMLAVVALSVAAVPIEDLDSEHALTASVSRDVIDFHKRSH